MALAAPIRVVFDEARFRRLVSGGVVADAGVEIIMSDIGWFAVLRAVCDAISDGGLRGPPDPKQAAEFLPNKYTRRRDP